MNAICRNFPQNVLNLLKDNKLCTTLFCISSALKKLSQITELPESRCAPHPPQCTHPQHCRVAAKGGKERDLYPRRRCASS